MSNDELQIALCGLWKEFVEYTCKSSKNYDDMDFTFDRFMMWLNELREIKD